MKKLYEISLIDRAEDIAQMVHIGQKRRNQRPYIIHPKRIQLIAKELKYGTDVQAIALLHDVVEDSVNPKNTKDLIRTWLGDDILKSILLLTHNKSMSYNDYLLSLASNNSIVYKNAFKVKILDIMNNLLDKPTKSQLIKYKDAIEHLLKNGITNIPESILNILGLNNDTLQEADDKKDNDKKDKAPPDKPGDTTPKDAPPDSPPDSGDSDAGDGEGPPDGGDNGVEEGDGEDDKSILKFSKKLSNIKPLQLQREVMPSDVDFVQNIKVYADNMISTTKNGSILIGIPQMIENKADGLFVKNVVSKYIIKKFDTSNNNYVVYVSNMNLSNKLNLSTKILIDELNKYRDTKKIKIKIRTYNPIYNSDENKMKKFISFMASTTGSDYDKIKCALYLFFSFTGDDTKKKMKVKNSKKILLDWNINSLNMEELKRLLFPDIYNEIENEVSYIIKVYLQLIRTNILILINKMENKLKKAIIVADFNTAWSLHDTFKNVEELMRAPEPKGDSEQKEETPPENAGSDDENKEKDEKQEK